MLYPIQATAISQWDRPSRLLPLTQAGVAKQIHEEKINEIVRRKGSPSIGSGRKKQAMAFSVRPRCASWFYFGKRSLGRVSHGFKLCGERVWCSHVNFGLSIISDLAWIVSIRLIHPIHHPQPLHPLKLA